MLRGFRIAVVVGLCWWALVRPAAAAEQSATAPVFANEQIVLTAEQSAGGTAMKLSDGRIAGVMLDKSCTANFKSSGEACIEWKLAAPLPAGWWRGTAYSGFRAGYANRDFAFMLVSADKPSVTVAPNFVNYEKDKPQIFEFWIHSSTPAESVRIQPSSDLWKWNHTWPITKIVLEHREPSELTGSDAVTLDLPVRPDGSVHLPQKLPVGNWSLGGKIKAESMASFLDDEGKSVQVPMTVDRYKRPLTSYAFMDAPVRGITFAKPNAPQSILLRHNVSRSPTPFATQAQPMVTVDPAKTEVEQLVMIGEALDGEGPTFPLLPRGLNTAVLTSWDDGKPEDLRCAQILHKHGYRPTFFLNQDANAMKILGELEALNVEIGAHGYHHPSLYAIAPRDAAEECVEIRKVLEGKLNHPVISFGYPNGYSPAYDAEGDYVLRAVKAAGYWSGRTTGTKAHTVESYSDLAAMETDGFFGYAKELEKAFETTRQKKGGVFYFWGHSWQIGKTDEQWQTFEDFVAKFGNQPDVWYASQGELSLWLWSRKNVEVSVMEKRPTRVSVELKRPWLHPYLSAKCPLTLAVPAGVTKVLWRGKEIPVVDGMVEVAWDGR